MGASSYATDGAVPMGASDAAIRRHLLLLLVPHAASEARAVRPAVVPSLHLRM